MALNGLFARMESLINSDGEVDDGMPCKSDILDLRECRKGGDKGVSFFLFSFKGLVWTSKKRKEQV